VDQLLEQVLDAAGRVIGRYPEGELATGLYTVVNANTIESRIYLVPASERPESTTEVTQRWRQETGVLTGVQSSTFVSNRGGPGSGAALTVQLSHRDIAVLEQAARSLAKELEAFPNTSDIDDGSARGKRQMDFELKEIAQRIGLTAREIVSQVRAAVYGIEAFRQQRQKNEITLRVRLPEAQRRSLHDLDYLLIRSPGGVEAYLSDLVEFKEGRAYTSINRSNGRRILSVMADVEPQSDTNKVINVLKQTTLPELQQTYPGLSYSFEGRQADMRDSIKTLRSGLIVVLIVIYALLALMFRSYVQPLLVMFAIPFSIIGAVFGHFLMGYSMSIMSLFGLLALTGVVVNDSLVLIDFANHNRRRIDSVTDSLVEAAVRRFRPIMLTTLTTFVGLAPMIFETSRQARFLIPMALSLGFGIIFATMITLLFVPALYMIIEDIQAVLHRKPTVQNEAAEQPKMDFRTHC
jgi:multidrug efflux pump subunit AcrB